MARPQTMWVVAVATLAITAQWSLRESPTPIPASRGAALGEPTVAGVPEESGPWLRDSARETTSEASAAVEPIETTGGRRLDVRVTDAHGIPVAGARVTVQMQAIQVPTDADGRASIGPLDACRACAWAEAPGYVQEHFSVPSADQHAATVVATVVLQRAHSIGGQVVWSEGGPAADVDVQGPGVATKTGGDGRFSLTGFPPGEHEIRAGRDRGWRWGGIEGVQARVLAGTTDLALVLPGRAPTEPRLKRRAPAPRPEPEELHGKRAGTPREEPRADTEALVTVVDPAFAPVAGARVRFWPRGGFPLIGETDGVGRARLRGWSPGAVGELDVEPPMQPDGTLLETSVSSWRPRDEVVRLASGVKTSGSVRDLEGNAVPYADVERQAADGSWEACGRCGDDGTFEIRPLLPGTVTLRASLEGQPAVVFGKARTPGVAAHTGRARVVAAGASSVVLHVDVGLPLRVRLDGWPVASPTLDALVVEEGPTTEGEPFAHHPVGAPVDASGRVEFLRLDRTKTYSLWVGPLFDGRYALARGVRGGDAVQTIHLQRGHRTEVRVAGAGGRELSVTARIGEFWVGAAQRGDGLFEFWGLPAGTWDVGAESGFGDDAVSGRATVRAGGHVDIVASKQPAHAMFGDD